MSDGADVSDEVVAPTTPQTTRYSTSWLISLAVPGMLTNAAQPIAELSIVVMLSHTGSNPTVVVAAYALATSTVSFCANVFNFLLSVTMSEVGRAVGGKRWNELGRAIRVALTTALVAAAVCVGMVMLCKEQIYWLFSAVPAVRAEADVYIVLRVAAVPLLFVGRVASSVLVGFQRIRLVAAITTLQACACATGAWVALRRCDAGLQGTGYAYLAAITAGCCALLTAMTTLPPATTAHRIRWYRDTTGTHSIPSPSLLAAARSYLSQSGNMMVRSLMLQGAVFALYVVASRENGTTALTAHQVIAQLWGLTSYVCDGFADVGTMLASKLIGEGRPEAVRRLSRRLLAMGEVVAGIVVIVLVVGEEPVQRLFTRDPAVSRLLQQNWVLLVAMQPINAAVFITDGVLIAFGAPAFRFIRNLMLVGVCCLFAPSMVVAVEVYHTLLALWVAKNILTTWRCACALWFIELRPVAQPRDSLRCDGADATEKSSLLSSEPVN
eukprot:m.426291 g.426291  ORF g.426291 m.426291 type:complete len:496 (-) comp57342_c0_seq1:108-1595(-)